MKITKKEIITIIILYVVFFAVVTGPALASDSMVGSWIVLIVGLFCYFKFTKGRLNDALGQFIWPVWLVGMLILGSTIGVFIAPYHLGKWIASQIPDKMDNKLSNDYLMSLNEEQLKNIWKDLNRPCLIISKEYSENFGEARRNQEFLQRPIDNIYNCKTVGEALEQADKVMEVVRTKYPKQINLQDLVR